MNAQRHVAPLEDGDPLACCSLCLDVQLHSGWTSAEQVIRELRSFEHAKLLRLGPGLCDRCWETIDERRSIARAEAPRA